MRPRRRRTRSLLRSAQRRRRPQRSRALPDDIIPPFEWTDGGVTKIYPGKNMDAHFSGGYTGAELLANGAAQSRTGAVSGGHSPGSDHRAGEDDHRAGRHDDRGDRRDVRRPGCHGDGSRNDHRCDSSGAVGDDRHVPERTVTLPPTTETVNQETVVRPAETVTLPEAIGDRSETAGATPTILTATGPDEVVDEGTVASTQAVITVPLHARSQPRPPTPSTCSSTNTRGKTVIENVAEIDDRARERESPCRERRRPT